MRDLKALRAFEMLRASRHFPPGFCRACYLGFWKGPEGLLERGYIDIDIDIDVEVEVDVDIDRYFGCFKAVSSQFR